MSTLGCLLLAFLVQQTADAPAPGLTRKPQGLGGLGPPGGLLKTVDPKVSSFEAELLAAVNRVRRDKNKPPLTMDERLRRFARREAELAATGSPETRSVGDRIKRQGLAPFGHYIQFAFGQRPAQVVKRLNSGAGARAALLDDFARVGVGAFWIPDEEPGFQIALLLTRDPDPMAGKPGLSREQTDPVIATAMPKIRQCYNQALRNRPNLKGHVLIQVVIDGQGAASEVKLVRSLGADAFDDCTLGVVRALRFPKPYKDKPVTLRHPIRLMPPQGDRRVGQLTPSQISGSFRTASNDFQGCYDARVKAQPDLAGTLTVAGTVAVDGTFRSVEIVDDELADAKLRTCVLRRAKQIRFPIPKHKGEVDVAFPLSFAPHRSAKR